MSRAESVSRGKVWSTRFDRELRRVIDAIRLGDLDAALEMAERVAVRAGDADDGYAKGRALTFIAEIALLKGQHARALECGKEAEELLRSIGLWGGVSRVCRILADVARNEGAVAEAWRHVADAISAAETMSTTGPEGDVRSRALFECHVLAAGLLRDENRIDEGLERLKQADLLAVEMSDPMLLGDLSLVRGRCEWLLDARRGLELIRRAARIYANNRLTLRTAMAHEEEGDCLLSIGDLPGARDAYSTALALCADSNTEERVARLAAVVAGIEERLVVARSVREDLRSERNEDVARSTASVLSHPMIATLADPGLQFSEFCALVVAVIVKDLQISDVAAVVRDLGGGTYQVLASEPPELKVDVLLADEARKVTAIVDEELRLSIVMRSSSGSVPETVEVLRRLVALRLTDDVALEIGRDAAWPRAEPLRHGMIVASLEMQAVLNQVIKAAQADCTVLITGESGTGKERIARAAHELSRRKSGPFIVTNCAAFPSELVESKLFGHRKGAFTGATSDNAGIFRSADKGTLFLDEIGELPLALQPKLLRALDVGEIEPVGANCPVKVGVRVIAATNRELESEVAAGAFRSDLFHRLAVVTISIPPLRSRPADIVPLARHFAREICEQSGTGRIVELHPSAEALLSQYEWPGNVRQLHNVILRTLLLTEYRYLRAKDVRPWVPKTADEIAKMQAKPSDRRKLDEVLGEVIKTSMMSALRENAGLRSEACRQLGITRNRFYRMVKEHDIDLKSICEDEP